MKNIYHLVLLMALLLAGYEVTAQAEPSSVAKEDIAVSDFKKTGAFTPNAGQVLDENYQPVTNVLAKSSLPGLDIYLTEAGVTYVLLNYELDSAASQHPVYQTNNNHFKVHYSRVDVDLVGATLTQSQLAFKNEVAYKASYYYGDIKAEAVSNYNDVTVKNVYPGIDWHWFINSKGQPEYDFVVHAGYSSNVIKMQYLYANITPGTDNILISTRNGALREGALKAFAAKQQVAASYNYNELEKEVTFNIGAYNTANDLVIDPPLQLQWSAQYGGTFADGLRGVAADASNNAYLAGYTTSTNFPGVNPGNNAFYDGTFNGTVDAIVLKVSPAQTLLWASYMGGSGNDFANSVAVSPLGQIFLTGGATSGFPISTMSGAYMDGTASAQDIFIARFESNLRLVWSTFYGGNFTDEALKVICDSSAVLLTGYTASGNSFSILPIANSVSSYWRYPILNRNNAFILQFSLQGVRQWATGLRDTAIAYGTSVARQGNHAVLVGYSAGSKLSYLSPAQPAINSTGGTFGFVVHFDNSVGEYQRIIGGDGNDYITDVTYTGYRAYSVTGYTNSANFPLKQIISAQYYQGQLAGGYDAFVTRFGGDTIMTWSTYYGGTGNDVATAIASNASVGQIVTGFTFSTDFPVHSPVLGGYYQPVNRGNSDGFIATFTQQGIRTYSTYKGDSCYEYPADVAIVPGGGSFYICGEGLIGCGNSVPDTPLVNGSGLYGFCWKFGNTQTASCLNLGITDIEQPCPDISNGYAVLNYSGGTPPYTTMWGNGEVSDTAATLPAGENFVILTDSIGCIADYTFTLLPVQASLDVTNIDCDNPIGDANIQASYGNPPYNYLWSNTSAQQQITSDTVGNFTVTVTDYNGCSVSSTAAIGYNNVYRYGITVLQSPGCGNSNGILVATDFLRDTSMNAHWYNSQNQYLGYNDTIYNVPPGTYYIDTFNCINRQLVRTSVTVTDPGVVHSMAVQLNQPYPAGCGGGSTVYVEADIVNGLADRYLYQWSTGRTIVTTSSDLLFIDGGGYYNVTVTDSVGCSASASINARRDTVILSSDVTVYFCKYQILSLTPHSFYGDSVSYQPPQQNPSYYYTWSGPGGYYVDNGYNSSYVLAMQAGLYDVTVTNPQGCTATASYYMSFLGPNNLTLTGFPQNCSSPTGSASVTNVSPPLQGQLHYQWSDIQGNTYPDSSTITGLQAGLYYVTVTSTRSTQQYTGCVYVDYQLHESGIGLTVGGGGCNSTITVVANTSNFEYNELYTWAYNDTLIYTNIDYSAISVQQAGNYSVTVTGYNGCSVSASTNVANVPPPSLQYSAIQVPRCNSDSTDIIFTVSGGVPPYTGQTANKAVAPGGRIFQVTDSRGCQKTLSIITTPHNHLSASYTLVSPKSCNEPGMITITATGGAPPYIGIGTFATTVGSHQFVVSDSLGCRDTLLVTVGSDFTLSATATRITCRDTLSTITITPQGGVAPYSGDTGMHYNYAPGVYTFSVTDSGGCVATVNCIVPQSHPFNVTPAASAISCHGKSVLVNFIKSGGTFPYQGGNSAYYYAGTYTEIVTDNGGCADTVNFTLTQPPPLDLQYTVTSPVCNGQNGVVTLAASGGTPAYNYNGSLTRYVPAGNYEYVVTDNKGCRDTAYVTVTQPPLLVANYTLQNILCNDTNATVLVSATGGTPAYSGDVGIHTVPDGNYTYWVSDANGCRDMVQLAVVLPTPSVKYISETICSGETYSFNGQQLIATGNYVDTLTASTSCDSIVYLALQVRPEISMQVNATVCHGESYLFNGQQLTVTGNYIDTLTAITGCDSIVNLALQVAPEINTQVSAGICSGETYAFKGQQLTVTGNYIDSLTASTGCDSIIHLALQVVPEISMQFSASICNGESYLFKGQSLTSTGVYADTLTAQAGCDSIVTLNLTVLPALTGGFSEVICNNSNYTFNNQQLTQSGVYTDTLQAGNGCDSIVTLNLIVLPAFSISYGAPMCEGYGYLFNYRELTQPGIYTDTLIAVNGCDSIVTLTLELYPTARTMFSDAVCDGDMYTFNNQQLTQAGVYTDTLQAVNSCDSIITLTLYTKYGEAVTVDTAIQQGTTYTLPGGSTTGAAGTYTDTLVAANGCDSVITTNLSVVAGVGEVATLAGFTLQPNPASSYLFVGAAVPLTGIVVYNTTGQQMIVLEKPVPQNNTYRIDVQLLAAGTYVIEVKGNEAVARRRWVKM